MYISLTYMSAKLAESNLGVNHTLIARHWNMRHFGKLVCSQLMRACVMIGGNTQVQFFWTVTKRLHVWGGKFAVLSLHTFCRACLRCILHVGLWCGVIYGTCLVVCAKDFFAWLHSLFSPNACLCDGWGNTQVFWTVTKRFQVWGGNLLFYHYILSVVQPCRVFQILHL